MRRIVGWGIVLALVGAGWWIWAFLSAAGAFRTLTPAFDGTCTAVTAPGLVGVEDLTIDQETGVAYLSGYDRRAEAKGEPVPGAIFAYPLAAGGRAPVNLTPQADAGFLPHGISLHRAPDGTKTLFVINHGNGVHAVEVYAVRGSRLEHRRTVTGDALVSPNDLVGVGPDAFYVTNDHASPRGFGRTLEDYLRLRRTRVYFYDGREFAEVLSGIGGSNGINVSADGRTLYLSAASEQTVYVYDRDPATNTLVERAAVPVPGFADNLERLANGDLLLGVHSKIFELLGHMRDASKHAPSHVVRLSPDAAGGLSVATVYLNAGDEISGGSTAAAKDGRLIIGSIFEPKILDCVWKGAP